MFEEVTITISGQEGLRKAEQELSKGNYVLIDVDTDDREVISAAAKLTTLSMCSGTRKFW